MNSLDDSKAIRPGLLGLPLLARIQRDPLGVASHLQQTCGDVARLNILFRRIYYLFDPDLAREVLVEHHDALVKEDRLLRMFQTFQGRNVLTTEGADWVRQRRIVAPGFVGRKLAGYLELMTAAIDACVADSLPGEAGSGAEIDVDALTTRITMDVILRTLFSEAAGQGACAEVSAAVRGLSAQIMREAYWPIVVRPWMPFPGRAAKQRHLAVISALIDRHIRARLSTRNEDDGKQDILGMLLSARDELPGAGQAALSAQEVVDNCHLLFGAGFDTAASALTWWIALMAAHPNVVAVLRHELASLGHDASAESVSRLPYLNASLKEAMRLYPPSTALITRVAQRDFRVRDVDISKNTLLVVPIWQLHHDPRSFPEPMQYRPERFLPGAPSHPRGAFLPFGCGPHVCLGQQFAMIEMALIAARLVSDYDFAFPGHGGMPEACVDVVLKPKTRLMLQFTRRVASG